MTELAPGRLLHSLRLDDTCEAPEISILVSERPPGSEIRTLAAWRHRFGSGEAARICMDWMETRPCRWSRWTGAASLLGASFATGLIEGEMLTDRTGDGVARRHRRVGPRDAAVTADGSMRIRLVLDRTTPHIVVERRRQAFLRLRATSKLQALRLWDWLGWQGWMLPDLYALHVRGGTTMLADLIFRLALAEEQRAMKASEAPFDGRPLRDWRPEGW